jgi:hypothetical protein
MISVKGRDISFFHSAHTCFGARHTSYQTVRGALSLEDQDVKKFIAHLNLLMKQRILYFFLHFPIFLNRLELNKLKHNFIFNFSFICPILVVEDSIVFS